MNRVLASFKDESDGLFKARAANPAINQLLRQFKEAQQKQSQASLSHEEFKRLRRELKEAKEALEEKRRRLRELEQEKNRLERIRRAQPKVDQRRSLLERREELGDLPVITNEIVEARRHLEKGLELAERDINQQQTEIRSLESEIDRIKRQPELIASSEKIRALHQKVGSIRKADADRKGLVTEREIALNHAKRLHTDLRLDCPFNEVESLRLDRPERTRIQKLSTDYTTRTQERKSLEKNLMENDLELRSAQEELNTLPEPKDVKAAEEALEEIARHGDLEASARKEEITLQAEKNRLANLIKGLRFWSGSIEDLEALPIPSADTIEGFEKDHAELGKKEERQVERLVDAEKRAQELKAECESLQRISAVPSIEELTSIRSERNNGWRLIKRAWLENEDVSTEAASYSPDKELPTAYEEKVEEADSTADRMREKAEEVAHLERLQADIRSAEGEIKHLQEEEKALGERRRHFQKEWERLWSGLAAKPDSPRGMKEWIVEREKILNLYEKIRTGQNELDTLNAEILEDKRVLRDLLITSFGRSADELAELSRKDLLVRLSNHLKEEQKVTTRREKLREKISTAERNQLKYESQLKQNQVSHESWEKEWEKAIHNFGEKVVLQPESAAGFLEDLNQLFLALDRETELQRRISGIDEDSREFTHEVAAFCHDIQSDLQDADPLEAVEQLMNKQESAEDAETSFKELTKQLQTVKKRLLSAEGEKKEFQDRLEAMIQFFKVTELEKLRELHTRALEAADIRKRIEALEEELSSETAGETLDQLIKMAEAEERDALPSTLREIGDEIGRFDAEKETLNQQIGGLHDQLKRMDGSAAAAEAAEEMQSILAAMPDKIDRYVRLELAHFLLQKEMEIYREEHQDPVLAQAEKFFRTLTNESFIKLTTDLDDKNKPIIYGVRKNDEHVPVEGMSDGSRDQLYLAFRLASLLLYLEKNEPLPFIVDDILIKFDDERAAACMRVLADLSQRIQVLLFTHQARLIKIADDNLSGAVDLIELSD